MPRSADPSAPARILTRVRIPAAPGQDVTLVATVAANGVVHPTPPGSTGPVSSPQSTTPFQVTFWEGNQQIGAGQIDASGKASIVTNSLASGHHVITAHYGGDPNFTPSDSNTIDVFVGSLDGPLPVNVSRYGYHMHPTSIVVTFSTALDPARAEDLSNYHLVGRGPDGKYGTRDDVYIKIVSAQYNDADHTVTLRPARLIPLSSRLRLTVRGSGAKGVADTSETLLDGKSTGQPGSNYVTTVSRANFVYTKYAKLRAAKSSSSGFSLTPRTRGVLVSQFSLRTHFGGSILRERFQMKKGAEMSRRP